MLSFVNERNKRKYTFQIDMTWQERIIIDPEILVGKPIIKGTRLSVEFIIELLAQGWTTADILRNYPGITPDDIRACFLILKGRHIPHYPY